MAPDLHKREAGYTAGTCKVGERYMAVWARGGPEPWGHGHMADRAGAGTGGPGNRSLRSIQHRTVRLIWLKVRAGSWIRCQVPAGTLPDRTPFASPERTRNVPRVPS